MGRSLDGTLGIAVVLIGVVTGVQFACVGNDPDVATGTGDAGGPTADGALPPENLPPGCDGTKDPKDDACGVTDSVGVFVSAATGGDDTDGTKAKPLRTIGKAMEKARATGRRRIYVCEGTYVESLVLDSMADGLRFYGGFTCGDFVWTGAKAKIAPASSGYALRQK
jgi:hypothetical protein